MRVRGPNGLVIDVPEAIATGLVGDGSRGYELADSEPASEAPKRGPGRPRKTTK